MLRLFIAITLWLVPALAHPQHSPEAADPLDPFLYQAFAATTQEERVPVYHLGVQGRMEADGYRLTAVLEGFPAHAAGLRRGDVIRLANGVDYHPLQHIDNGTPTLLTVARNNSESEVSITPVAKNQYDSYRQATLNSIQQFSVGNKVIGYLRLWGLSRSTADLITLQQLVQQLALTDGMILDLRDGYGFFGEQHLSLFRGKLGEEYYGQPIALLINERTRGGLTELALGLADLDRVIT
ncbi:MAG: hypothetical protein RL120_14560, partial [Gammaproteobacteria bacterium]